jgi:hypothetical protein
MGEQQAPLLLRGLWNLCLGELFPSIQLLPRVTESVLRVDLIRERDEVCGGHALHEDAIVLILC